MSNNLWNRVADFFKEWDGEDMTKAMPLYADELREINFNRIELIRLERERKEIRNKAIEEMLGQIEIRFLGVHPDKLYWGYTPSDVVDICKEIAEEMKEVDNG